MIFILNSINVYRENISVIGYTAFINLIVGLIGIFIYVTMEKKIDKLKEEGVKSPYKTNIRDWPKLWSLSVICGILIFIYVIVVILNL